MSERKDIESHAPVLKKLLDRIDRILTVAERGVLAVAAVTVLIVMAIIATDALGRYFFNKPLIFTIDLVTRYLLPIIMLMSTGMVLRRAQHISVDLFATMIPVRFYQLLIGIGLLVTGTIFWIMAYRVGHASVDSFQQGKTSFGLIAWPIWLEQAIYAFCLGLMMVRLIHVAMTNILAAVLGVPEIGISIAHQHDDPLEEAL